MAENTVYEFIFRRMDGMIPLRKGLDAYSLRQKTIAANIANGDTPGYKARQVEFEEELKQALSKRSGGLRRTSTDHIPVRGGLRAMDSLQPEVVQSRNDNTTNGINNVDVEKEMATMATNQIQYAAAAKVMGTRFQMLKGAILGRM
jgi:flagellar basal-body rod protein FlgB